jgi:hypothetical protein
VLYVVLLFEALGAARFNLRTAGLALLAALLPFGPFVFERMLASRSRSHAVDTKAERTQ